MQSIRHLVLFPIRPEVPDEQVEEALVRLRGLATVGGDAGTWLVGDHVG